MTTPTRQEIQAAYKALDRLRDAASDGLPLNKFALESVMNDIHTVLPTIPRPTMADVEWDDDVHYLAEAEHSDGSTAVMVCAEAYGMILCAAKGETYIAAREDLTLTGKRYRLQEVQDD